MPCPASGDRRPSVIVDHWRVRIGFHDPVGCCQAVRDAHNRRSCTGNVATEIGRSVVPADSPRGGVPDRPAGPRAILGRHQPAAIMGHRWYRAVWQRWSAVSRWRRPCRCWRRCRPLPMSRRRPISQRVACRERSPFSGSASTRSSKRPVPKTSSRSVVDCRMGSTRQPHSLSCAAGLSKLHVGFSM